MARRGRPSKLSTAEQHELRRYREAPVNYGGPINRRSSVHARK